jgi:serine protease Do
LLIMVLFALPPSRAADYSDARAAFERLDSSSRLTIPLMLVTIGRYNGMVSGEMNKRIYRGILEYQASLGVPPTGILTASQDDRLHREGFQIWRRWGLQSSEMPMGRGVLYLPFNLVGYAQPTVRGRAYEAADSSVAIDLSVYAPGESSLAMLYAKLSKSAGRRAVKYKVLRDDFFVVSGTLGSRDYYTKYAYDRGYLTGFTLAWEPTRMGVGDRLAVLMSNTFFPGVKPESSPIVEDRPEPAQTAVAPAPVPSPAEPSRGGVSSGSGFFVKDEGLLVTNNHVVENCTSIDVLKVGPATILARDVSNDLALLRTAGQGHSVQLRASPIQLGEAVYALGYPFAGTLDNGLNFTNGLVSSLAGIQNDSRYIQVTAAVQPGNSGGPLMDEFGAVAGVVTARLNDINMLKSSGSLPQNVNFAIRSDFVMSFLRANGIEPNSAASGGIKMPASDIAARGREFTVQIVCTEAG